MSRTNRKPYRGPRAVDKTCRCHGGCPWCYGNRMHQERKAKLAADDNMKSER